jgi:DNA-3-methyladenine glycosylase I
MKPRCTWPGEDPLYVAYHDEEWGVPEHDDRALFEKLILDGFQAGLSWITILKKRDNFRAAFDGFEPERIARYNTRKVEALMKDAGIVRNRAKIEGTVKGARAYLDLRESGRTFDDFIWQFTDGRTRKNGPVTSQDILTESLESQAMSKALKSHGFSFCGPTICYAFMQAVGIINDHTVACFRYDEV